MSAGPRYSDLTRARSPPMSPSMSRCDFWARVFASMAGGPFLQAVARDDAAVGVVAVLGRSLRGRVVDVDQAEPVGVARAPLEVVQQAPGEIAAHVRAPADRVGDRPQVV